MYDAIRVLEAQGQVEVQHTSPKQFRAMPIEGALDRIRNRYQTRVDDLQEALNTIDPVETTDGDANEQAWSVSGREAIEYRTSQFVSGASEEIVLALGDESLLTEPFVEALTEAGGNVELIICAPTEALRDRIRGAVQVTTKVLSGPEGLRGPSETGGQVAMGRMLLIDRSASLISSINLDTDEEQAVFSQGPQTPLVFLISQLMLHQGSVIAPEFEA